MENKDNVNVKAAAAPIPPDEYPNKSKYADGHVFNLPISYYSDRTEATVRQSLISAGNEPEVIDPHMALIKEALRFYGADFKKE